MDEECAFCTIVDGDGDASVCYEDERVVVFLDVEPSTPGHALVVPREHAASVADLDESLGGHLFAVGMRVDAALRASDRVRAEGVNFLLADGEVAGQEVPHVHLHVFPRYAGDGITLGDVRLSPSREELDDVARSLSALL